MAALRHLEFAKIATLVKWPACDSSSPFRNFHKLANMALIYCQKSFFNMASVRHLEFEKLQFLWNFHARYLCTKFDRNRLIHGWDMEIMLFSKWRRSAILNLRKLQFWSRDLYRHVILHFCSKCRVDRPIYRPDIATFYMASVRHLEFEKFRFFVKLACSEWKFVSVYQIWSKSDNSRLRYGNSAIFKMAAVRHLEFAKIAVLVSDVYRHVILISVPNFALIGHYCAEN